MRRCGGAGAGWARTAVACKRRRGRSAPDANYRRQAAARERGVLTRAVLTPIQPYSTLLTPVAPCDAGSRAVFFMCHEIQISFENFGKDASLRATHCPGPIIQWYRL